MNHRLLTVVVLASSVCLRALAADPPTCLDRSLSIELIAAEPDIVTPVSCRFDSRGRLFVVESHTHFPPENYDGPKTDRIKILDDPDGDGKLDRVRVFYEGTVKTMGLAIARDDSIYLSTRAAILRLRDNDGDDVADETETLIELDTTADYPHNGLSGLLLEEPNSGIGTITFGMGENFGEPYRLSGSDGSKQVGGGEGGNVFRCAIDGSKLERIATGFWNPFGLCRDEAGRLLVVDNDADAMPPCRILNVVPQADYGFQFRFGRAGTHPLQAWNGELPGTLPMVAGTGEAPCAIMSYRGQYWVTSWGDNRIERYTPLQHGSSLTATRDVAVLGDAMFRPVDMAIAPDGAVYVTDWVDRSYNVHRKGRIWRIRFSTDAQVSAGTAPAPRQSLPDTATSAIGPVDLLAPLVLQRWKTIAEPVDEAVIANRRESILNSLSASDEAVRLYAVRWAAETGDSSLLPAVVAQLEGESLSPQMVAAVAAATSYLETGKVEKGGFDALTRQRLVNLAMDQSKTPSLRRIALNLVPPESPQWKINDLTSLVQENTGVLAREAAKHIAVAASSNDRARTAASSLISKANLQPEIALDLAIVDARPSSPHAQDEPRPALDDLDAWMKLVGEGGDAGNGWRLFFSSGMSGKCSSCHAKEGRGAGVGPDLTSLVGNMDRRRVLDSILNPGREVGPMYTTWKVLTTDGRTIAGIKLNGGGVGQSARYLQADATTVDVPLEQIQLQEASDKSIMPDGLAQSMTIPQLRDLLAFLTSASES